MPAPNWTYKEIEDAVLAALADLKKENGGACLTVDSYHGEFATEEAISAALGRFPMVLVTIDGSTYDLPANTARGTQIQTFRIMAFIGSRSWRSQGEAASGAYDLLGAIRDRLAGKVLGLTGVKPCFPRQENLIAASTGAVIYRAEYWLENPKMTWI